MGSWRRGLSVALRQIHRASRADERGGAPGSMTVLQALAILEAATVECKQRDINTSEVKDALDLLEPHIRPEWLIPQFRHHIGGERENDYQREGQQQVLRATFPRYS
jgi:hypothetical protein